MGWLPALTWYLIGVWAVTWLARRLLGARVPAAHTLLAGLLGLLIGLGGAALMRASNPGRELYAVDFLVISLLATLVLVALSGLLVRPQTGTHAHPEGGQEQVLRRRTQSTAARRASCPTSTTS